MTTATCILTLGSDGKVTIAWEPPKDLANPYRPGDVITFNGKGGAPVITFAQSPFEAHLIPVVYGPVTTTNTDIVLPIPSGDDINADIPFGCSLKLRDGSVVSYPGDSVPVKRP